MTIKEKFALRSKLKDVHYKMGDGYVLLICENNQQILCKKYTRAKTSINTLLISISTNFKTNYTIHFYVSDNGNIGQRESYPNYRVKDIETINSRKAKNIEKRFALELKLKDMIESSEKKK